MAREPVVAIDFLGLGKSLHERDSDVKAEERGKLVKPTASLATTVDQSTGRGAAVEGERGTSISRHIPWGEKNSHLGGALTFSLSQGMPWASVVGKSEEAERRLAEKAPEGKPLEEITDADIEQLTVEDCRRYLQLVTSRGLHRSATNNNAANSNTSNNRGQAIQQMVQGRGLIEARQEDEKSNNRRGASPVRSGLSDAGPSGAAVQHDATGPATNSSGGRNGFQAPRYNSVPQQISGNEEAHGGARPSDRPVHGLDSNLSLSIPLSREQPPAQSSGFGSPLPSFLRMIKPPDHSQRPPQSHTSGQAGGAAARPIGQNHLPGRPPTAQLTIFYAGMVNVYDDVPSDKAQAIMLLAGSGSSWSPSFMNPPPSLTARPQPSTGGMASSSNAPAPAPPAPTPAITQGGAVTPLIPAVPSPDGLKQVAGRPTLHAELPQARKASLARFLEKRKDRVRGKSPYVGPIFPGKRVGGDGSLTPPREKSPSPSNGKIQTRLPSPVNTIPPKRSPSPAPRPGPSHAVGSEASSPSRRPVTPQHSSQPSTSEDQAPTTGSQRPSKDEHVYWASQQQIHSTSQEQKPELMEEEAGSPPSQRH